MHREEDILSKDSDSNDERAYYSVKQVIANEQRVVKGNKASRMNLKLPHEPVRDTRSRVCKVTELNSCRCPYDRGDRCHLPVLSLDVKSYGANSAALGRNETRTGKPCPGLIIRRRNPWETEVDSESPIY